MPGLSKKSATETQTLDEVEVTSLVIVLQVAQQAAALADQLEQTTTTVVIVLVGLEVLGELSDTLGQQGDLDLGGAGVPFGECVLSDDGGRLGTVKRHVISLFKAQQPQQGTFGATTLGGGSPSCPATEADREIVPDNAAQLSDPP